MLPGRPGLEFSFLGGRGEGRVGLESCLLRLGLDSRLVPSGLDSSLICFFGWIIASVGRQVRFWPPLVECRFMGPSGLNSQLLGLPKASKLDYGFLAPFLCFLASRGLLGMGAPQAWQ